MKRILTYLIAFTFMFCVFSVNVSAEENENTNLEGEETVTVLATNDSLNLEPVADVKAPAKVETAEGESDGAKEEPAPEVKAAPAEEDAVETTEPEHEKTIDENEDGTYTLSLTVKGESEEAVSYKKVNVVVMLDTSGSMDDAGSTTVTYEATTSSNGTSYGLVDGEYVKLSYSNSQRRYYYTVGNSSNRIYYDGTRYKKVETTDKRMDAAKAAVNSLAESLLSNNGGNNPDDTVQISLISFATNASVKQQPTTSFENFQRAVNSLTANGGTNWEAVLKSISSVNFNDDDETYVIFVSDGNPTFYTTNAGNGDYNSQYGVYGTGKETETNIERSYNAAVDDAKAIVDSGAKFYTIGAYGNVDRMESLTTAAGAPKTNYYSAIDTLKLQEALDAILQEIKSAGIGAAKITDGTTSCVATSAGVSHLLTVDEESYKYYKDDVEWEDAPEATLNEDGEVVWDLGSGLLDNDVTYKISFTVWASQETLDLVADLKNGTKDYDSLDANIKKYITKTGEGKTATYSLATNTVATLSYKDTREQKVTKRGDDTKSVVYVNPEPESQDVPSMEVEKEWANDIDELSKSPITIELLRDGELNATITLNNDNNYSAEVFIAPGRIHVQGNSGKYQVREDGHDYTFRETGSDVHNWELSSEVFHPMLINDEMTMLVRRDSKPEGSEITNYFIINDEYYEISTVNKFVATNERRSWIDITKSVTSETNDTFDFEISVTDPNGDDIEFVVTSGEDTISENDGLVVTGATLNAATGSYTATSGESFTVSIKAGWNIRVMNLLSNSTYSISEVNIDSKYELDEVKFDGEEVESDGTVTGTIDSANNTYSYEYVNKVVATDIVVLVEWEDEDDKYLNRPTNVVLHLSNGTELTQPTMEATRGLSWKYVYKNVPIDGTYTLTQDTVLGYEDAVVTGNAVDGFTVTNTLSYVERTVVKAWDDDDYENRPSEVVVTLSRTAGNDTEDIETITLSSNVDWTYTNDTLPAYYNGEEASYEFVETVPENYVANTAVEGTTTTITNSLNLVTITVKKIWEDEDNAEGLRPENVTFVILADGEETDNELTLSEDNEWKDSIQLQKYVNGEEVTYSISEYESNYYESNIEQDGYNFEVTNSREVEYVEINIKKIWEDEDNAEGLRPDSVTFVILADGEETDNELTLSEDNEWKDSIELQKYVNGEEVTYSISEYEDDYYESNIEQDGYNFEVTNSREVEYIDLTVRKVWDDDDNIEGSRPDSLTVTLSDGTEVTLNEDNEWEATVGGLQVYVDGEEVEYTWEEEDVDGYDLTNTEVLDDVITVLTNTHKVVKTIDITVIKVWDVEVEDESLLPPVTIILNANGEKYASVELTAEDGWTYTFEGLDKYADREVITYEVVEVQVEGYKAEITGNAEEGFVVTNTISSQGGPTEDPDLPPHTGIDTEDNSLMYILFVLGIAGLAISKKKIYE